MRNSKKSTNFAADLCLMQKARAAHVCSFGKAQHPYIGAQHETLWIQGIGTANVIWPYEYGLPGNDSFNTLYTLCAMSGDEVLYSYDLDIIGIINNCTEWHFKDDALNDTPSDVTGARKFLRDGHIYISTPIGTFNATGKLVE